MSIVMQLDGRLGNQLFQYAFGRALAIRHNTDLYLNPCSMVNSGLDDFNIKYKHTQELGNCIGFSIIKERTMDFDLELFNEVPNNAYLIGFWQNEKYFEFIKDIILEEFTLKKPKEVSTSPYISLHIRGTDYKGWGLFDVIRLDYYKKAIEYFLNREVHPKFKIFTDDKEYALKFLEWLDISKKWDTSKTPGEALVSMSLCNNNIIANSSFSWWASWLNKKANKIIIAPSTWFNPTYCNEKELKINPWTDNMVKINNFLTI